MLLASLDAKFERILDPVRDFIRDQTVSSILLIACTIAALAIANSPWSAGYEAWLRTPLGVVFGNQSLVLDLRHWINDGLMALFFFLLGLEMKREILAGELSDRQRLSGVVAAALGGMVVPALLFYGVNRGTEYINGWGIPMATDTAFVIGLLALLGRHVPVAAFVFLTALAIIDDLGAILVIALFYSEDIQLARLSFAGLAWLALVLCNALGVRKPLPYLIGGALVWLGMLGSGVHATVAGILVAFTVPARARQHPRTFVKHAASLLRRFARLESDKDDASPMLGEQELHSVAREIEGATRQATTPLRRWERVLDHPVSLFVMPIFALANAGIPVHPETLSALWTEPLAVGILLGLVAGKCLGIFGFAWLAMRIGLGRLPDGLEMRHLAGLGMLAGIGFTMSIFISNLGFEQAPDALLIAKTAILAASFCAALGGFLWLRWQGRS